MSVVLVGGSGFLGQGLRSRLVAAGHAVTVIGRGRSVDHGSWRHVHWDARSLGDWTPTLEGAGVRQLDDPPTAWVQLSSLAIFGDTGDEIIDESAEVPSTGLRQQVEVCRRWEAAFREATNGIARTVLLRPAIGIGGDGDPATRQLSRLARLGLGGAVAGGDQWVSWIAAEDFFDLLERAVVDSSMTGLYHLAVPTPVTNARLMAALPIGGRPKVRPSGAEVCHEGRCVGARV